MKVYFDNAATTPLYPEVVEKITEVLSNTYGNPIHLLTPWGVVQNHLIEYSSEANSKRTKCFTL